MTPLPPTISDRWRPMWHPNAYLSRPWWRMVDGHPFIYVRLDGWRVERGFNGGIFVEPPGDILAEMPGLTFVDDGMAYVDTKHPLPAPDPMPGQVWRLPHGVEYVLAQTDGDGDGQMSASLGRNWFTRKQWPPPGAVLVAGPTPWGRDVPWAPTVAK